MTQKGYRQRRTCTLAGIDPRVYRRLPTRSEDFDLRARSKEQSSQRRRFGYRRLHLLLRREGWFDSLRHARNLVAAWRDDFNHHRPHSSLAGMTPWEYANRSKEDQNLNRANS